MTRPQRPGIRWPLYVSAWCLVAVAYAAEGNRVFLAIVGALSLVAIWAIYALGRPTDEDGRR